MNINDVKKELSSDEKVLESAFKLETLYKKYKFMVWGVAGAVLLFFVATTAMDGINQAKLKDANSALLALQKDPKDAAALSTLKEKNPTLFELYTFSKASSDKDPKALSALTSSKNEVIADASRYTAAALENKAVDSKLYKELSLLEQAYLSIKSGDTQSAKAKLELIDERSSLQMLTQLLEHSMIKAK